MSSLPLLREAGPETEEHEEANGEVPFEAKGQQRYQGMEEDTVEDSSTGHLDRVYGAAPSEIRKAVEELFEVKVTSVSTMNMLGKNKRLGRFFGRRASWKKAIVSVAEGQTIDIYEAV